jgi:hypothetical protein
LGIKPIATRADECLIRFGRQDLKGTLQLGNPRLPVRNAAVRFQQTLRLPADCGGARLACGGQLPVRAFSDQSASYPQELK